MTTKLQRRIMGLVPADLTDDDLDIYIGEARRLASSLADSAAWQEARQRRADNRALVTDKLDALVAEAETRGIRVKKGKPPGPPGGPP